jgi:hypothetical protein
MGLIVDIYRSTARTVDCTNGGPSSKFTTFCLTNVDGPFEPRPDCPAAKLVKNALGTVKIVPESLEGKWTMFGGNYAATSDSRLGEAVEAILGHRLYGAIAVHDRVEW